MKLTEIAAVLRKAANDMEALAAREGDLDYPHEALLPFIVNFLTDRALRKLSLRSSSSTSS